MFTFQFRRDQPRPQFVIAARQFTSKTGGSLRFFEPKTHKGDPCVALRSQPSACDGNCFSAYDAPQGRSEMLQSAECVRHATRCAVLAKLATERTSRTMWAGMATRWLCRADAWHKLMRQNEKAKTVTFKSQPQFDLAIQPIIRVAALDRSTVDQSRELFQLSNVSE
jgi:hypothetical protein